MTISAGLFSQHPIAASTLVLLLVIGIAISSYFAKQRLKQTKTRLAAVLVANIVSALAVIGLAFDIQITCNQASVIYLISNGVTSEQLQQIDTQQPIFVMHQALKSITDNNILDVAKLIDIPSQILSQHPTFNNLHIVGDGLNSSQWQDIQQLMGKNFNNISVTFTASKPRIGLVNMQWTRELAVGQFVEIEGQLQGTDEPTTDNIYQLSLLDPVGQVIETKRLKATERFTFSFAAKTPGQWVYRLQLSKTGDTSLITNEPIAFSVSKPVPVRILIKQSAPSFETRQLKHWASQFAGQISVLTQISQNRDIRQNINLSAQVLQHTILPFTEQSLVNFDWLLIDGRALIRLTMQQMTALQTAINNGLGVYIIADNALVNAWPVSSLDWIGGINIQPLDVANYSDIPYWPHSNIEQALPLVKAAITSASGVSIVKNNNEQILVSHSNIGLGQVAVSLINATYGWQTSGMTEQYSHYWQSVIYGLARPKKTPYWLTSELDSLPLSNYPQHRCLIAAVDSGVATHNQNSQPLILTSDLLQNERSCITIWPTYNGWHKLVWSKNIGLSETQNIQNTLLETWFYAHTEQDWSVWQQAQKGQVSQNVATQKNTNQSDKQSMKSLDKIWLWGLLVLLMSVLWLERKLF